MYHPIRITWPPDNEQWPDPFQYDFYSEEFTPEDERQWKMSEVSKTIKLAKQTETNKRFQAATDAHLSMYGTGDGEILSLSVEPGNGRYGASITMTRSEVVVLVDQLDRFLGRKPRKEELRVVHENGKLTIYGIDSVIAPF